MTFLPSILLRYIYFVVLLYFTGIGRDVCRYGVSVWANNEGVQAPAFKPPNSPNSAANDLVSNTPEFSEQFSASGRRFPDSSRSVAGADRPAFVRSHAVRSTRSLNYDHESIHGAGMDQEGRLSDEHSRQNRDLFPNAAVGVVLDLRDPQGFEVNSEMKNGLLYKEICTSGSNPKSKTIRRVDLGSQHVWEAGPEDFCRCVTLISQLSTLYPDSNSDSNAFLKNSTGNLVGSHVDGANNAQHASADASHAGSGPEKRLLFIEVLNNSIYKVNYYSILTYTETNESKVKQISQRLYNVLLHRLARFPALDPEYLEHLDSEVISEQAHLETDRVDGIKRPPVQPLSTGLAAQEAELDEDVSRLMNGQPHDTSAPPKKLNRFTRLKYVSDFGDNAQDEQSDDPNDRFNLNRSQPVFELESVEPVGTTPQENTDLSHNQTSAKLSHNQTSAKLSHNQNSADLSHNQNSSDSPDTQDQRDLSSNLFTHFANSRDRSSTPGSLSNHQSMDSMLKLHKIGANGSSSLDGSLSGVWSNKKLDITDPGQNPHVYFEYEVNDGIPILSVRPRKKGLTHPINVIYESQNLIWNEPDSRMNELRAFSSYGEFKLVELVYQTKLVTLLASQQQPDYGEQYITYFKKDGNRWKEVPIKEYEVTFKQIKSSIAHIASVYLDIGVFDNTDLFFQKGELGQQFEAMTYFPLTGYTLNLVKDGDLIVWQSDKKRCLAAVVIRALPAHSDSLSPRISLGGTTLNLGSGGAPNHGQIKYLKLELVGSSKNNKRPKNLFFKRVEVSDLDHAQAHSGLDGSNNQTVDQTLSTNQQTEQDLSNEQNDQTSQQQFDYKYVEISETDFENAINGQLNVDLESFLPPDVADEASGPPNEHIYNIYHDLPTSSIGYDDLTTLTGAKTIFHKDLSKAGSEIDLELLSKLLVKDSLDEVLKRIEMEKQANGGDTATQVFDVDNLFRDAAKDFLPELALEQDQTIGKHNDDTSSHTGDAPLNAAQQQHVQQSEPLKLDELGDKPEHRVNMRSIDKVQNWLNRSPNMPTNNLEDYDNAHSLEFDQANLSYDFVGAVDNLHDAEHWEHSGVSRQLGSLDDFDLPEDEPLQLEQLDVAQYSFYTPNSHQGVEYRTFDPPEGSAFNSISYNGQSIWKSNDNEFSDFVRVFFFNHEPKMGLFRLIDEANYETRDIYFILDEGAWKFVTSQVMMDRFNAAAEELTRPQTTP